MKHPVASILMISSNENTDLTEYLMEIGCDVIIENDWGKIIQRVQNRLFNVIILDTRVDGINTKQAIHILNNIDPDVKIIVKTDYCLKEFETQIRQEKIFYYHIDSFEKNDLELAIKSAIATNRHRYP